MRILAIPREVVLDGSTAPLGACLRGAATQHDLGPREYATVWQLCGATRARGDAAVGPDANQLAQRLLAEGLLRSVDVEPASIAPQHQVRLVDDVELRPTLFVVVGAQQQRVRLLGQFAAKLLEACTGQRSVAELCAVMRGLGYQVAATDVGAGLSYLHSAGLIEGATPTRRAEIVVQPEAIVARKSRGDLGYLLSADEADLLVQCRGRSVAELQGELDPEWVSRVVAKACALGLLVATRPSQAQVAAPVRMTPPPRVAEPAPAPDPDFDNTFVESEATQIGPPPGELPPEETTPTGAGQVLARQSQPIAIVTPDPARLAQLAGLSLPKDDLASLAPKTRAPASNKLPWILLAIVIIGGGYYHYTTVRDRPVVAAAGSAQAAADQPSTPRVHHALLASGYIAAKVPIVLSATTSGRLEKLNVDNGDRITKGQLLAVVADGQVRAELSLAHARVRDAKRALQRTRTLIKAQAATPSDLERAVGAVEIAQAEARVIAQRLEETRIKSPIDGTVLEVLVHPGEAITGGPDKGAGLLRVADLSELVAEVNVGETELKQVFVGQECEIVSEAQRDKPHRGTVREIAEQADRARGTVLVKVDIEPMPESVLKPGMAVQVRFNPPAPPATP